MSSSRLEEAIFFAAQAHRGHTRTGEFPLPYFSHVMDVLYKVRHLGQVTDEDVLCAAVLHDVLEDTPFEQAELAARFGDRAARIVAELTRRKATAGEVSRSGVSEQDLNSARLLDEIREMGPEAQVIKLADRLSNLWESGRTRPVERTGPYAEEARQILGIVPRERAPELWDALDAQVRQILAK